MHCKSAVHISSPAQKEFCLSKSSTCTQAASKNADDCMDRHMQNKDTFLATFYLTADENLFVVVGINWLMQMC